MRYVVLGISIIVLASLSACMLKYPLKLMVRHSMDVEGKECEPFFSVLHKEIAKKNHCYSDADCVLLEGTGDCEIVANRKTASRIHDFFLKDERYAHCFNDCDEESLPLCRHGQCVRMER